MVYVGGFPPRVKNPEIRSIWGGIRKIRKSAKLGPLHSEYNILCYW